MKSRGQFLKHTRSPLLASFWLKKWWTCLSSLDEYILLFYTYILFKYVYIVKGFTFHHEALWLPTNFKKLQVWSIRLVYIYVDNFPRENPDCTSLRLWTTSRNFNWMAMSEKKKRSHRDCCLVGGFNPSIWIISRGSGKNEHIWNHHPVVVLGFFHFKIHPYYSYHQKTPKRETTNLANSKFMKFTSRFTKKQTPLKR